MHFVHHAFSRLIERSGLKTWEVKEKIDNGDFIPLGICEKKKNVHKLIYDENTDSFLVLVHDEPRDEIVTVLFADYHENLGWKIDYSMMKELKDKYCARSEVLNTPLVPEKENNDKDSKPSVLHVNLFKIDSSKLKTRIHKDDLAKWGFTGCFECNDELKDFLLHNLELKKTIINWLVENEVSMYDIHSFTFSIGSNRNARFWEIPDFENELFQNHSM